MAILSSDLYLILSLILYIFIAILLFADNKSYLYIFMLSFPMVALYFLSVFFLIPLPLNAEALYSVYNANSPIEFIPFQYILKFIETNGVVAYVIYIMPLISAAFIIGIGIPFIIARANIVRTTIFGCVICIPFLLIQIFFRVLTGYEGKVLDITELLFYIVFSMMGWFVYKYIDKLYPNFKKKIHVERKQNDD